MTQYYYTDGKERYGPFSIEQLQEKNLKSDTLVWKEGLVDWVPAKNISELESLFSAPEISNIPGVPPLSSPYVPAPLDLPPKNWLVESVLITVLCCIPFGIVGIIHATRVETLWNSGQREASINASREAGKWVKIGFFAGLAVWIIIFLSIIFSAMAELGTGSFHE